MKYLIAVIFVCLSLATHAQDVEAKLAGSMKKMWIGSNSLVKESTANYTSLIFYKNHTVVEYNSKTHTAKVPRTWKVMQGEYLDQDNYILQIADRKYNVAFSKTANGKNFMIITGTAVNADETIANTYHEE